MNTREIGHNSVGSTRDLKDIVARLERMDGERRDIVDDMRTIYAEAKAKGFNPKLVRRLLAERRRDRAEVEDELATLDLYRDAVG